MSFNTVDRDGLELNFRRLSGPGPRARAARPEPDDQSAAESELHAQLALALIMSSLHHDHHTHPRLSSTTCASGSYCGGGRGTPGGCMSGGNAAPRPRLRGGGGGT